MENLQTDVQKNHDGKTEALVPISDAGSSLAMDGVLGHPSHALTDLGNAERFVNLHGSHLRYDHTKKKWYVWNGKLWMEDVKGEVFELAKETVRSICGEAVDSRMGFGGTELIKFALLSESHRRIRDMLSLASTDPRIAVTSAEFDSDPWLLNLENGIIDLRTFEFSPHDPAKLMSKVAPVRYDRAAQAPQWEAFLETVFGGKHLPIEYVQRCVGYSLTGETGEQGFFFAHGPGANGKSAFFAIMEMLLGDYWQKAPAEMLMMKRGDGIPNDVARLKGARFVVATESMEGGRLNEARIKDLTGGDTVVARYLHGEFFEFRPTHKLWLYGNHKPVISGTDEGIWRRVRYIPFSVTIPERERIPLPELLAMMRDELPGIFNWALWGLRHYYRMGVAVPDTVKNEIDLYRAEMDVVGRFIGERCVRNPFARATFKDVHEAYSLWCHEGGERPLTKRKFSERLVEMGFVSVKGAANVTFLPGLGLLPLDDDSAE